MKAGHNSQYLAPLTAEEREYLCVFLTRNKKNDEETIGRIKEIEMMIDTTTEGHELTPEDVEEAEERGKKIACSFCRRRYDQVIAKRLITRQEAHICLDCVALCGEILRSMKLRMQKEINDAEQSVA